MDAREITAGGCRVMLLTLSEKDILGYFMAFTQRGKEIELRLKQLQQEHEVCMETLQKLHAEIYSRHNAVAHFLKGDQLITVDENGIKITPTTRL